MGLIAAKRNPEILNLTGQEVEALPEKYNLADGHADRTWSAAELNVVAMSASIFRSVNRRQQREIEAEYLDRFFELSRQSLCRDYCAFFLCFTASMGLEVIANYLRLRGMSACLIEPCFDNLADILKRHRVPLQVFPDYLMKADGKSFQQQLATLTADAIFLVTPNNPTGVQLPERNLLQLAQFCKDTRKLLILDTCFRFYEPEEDVYDQYRILIESGADFIVLEDTGKTWPTLEIKAPFLAVSESLADRIHKIFCDFLLHVSPFAITLLTEFVKLSLRDARGQIRNAITTNRQTLYADLKGTFLEPQESQFASVSWLWINHPFKATELKKRLANRRVHVLAGDLFFWSDPAKGEKFLRIALARDREIFTRASQLLKEVCLQIEPL